MRFAASGRLPRLAQPRSAIAAHVGAGGARQADAEQIGHRLRQPLLRQKLIMERIDDEILLLCLLAVLAGADSFVDIARCCVLIDQLSPFERDAL